MHNVLGSVCMSLFSILCASSWEMVLRLSSVPSQSLVASCLLAVSMRSLKWHTTYMEVMHKGVLTFVRNSTSHWLVVVLSINITHSHTHNVLSQSLIFPVYNAHNHVQNKANCLTEGYSQTDLEKIWSVWLLLNFFKYFHITVMPQPLGTLYFRTAQAFFYWDDFPPQECYCETRILCRKCSWPSPTTISEWFA